MIFTGTTFAHLALRFFFELFFFFLLFCQLFLTFFVTVIRCCQCSLSMLKALILTAAPGQRLQCLLQVKLQIGYSFKANRETHQRTRSQVGWPT